MVFWLVSSWWMVARLPTFPFEDTNKNELIRFLPPPEIDQKSPTELIKFESQRWQCISKTMVWGLEHSGGARRRVLKRSSARIPLNAELMCLWTRPFRWCSIFLENRCVAKQLGVKQGSCAQNGNKKVQLHVLDSERLNSGRAANLLQTSNGRLKPANWHEVTKDA